MEENSLFRHDEQCVNIEGEEERDAMVKADRGAILVSREGRSENHRCCIVFYRIVQKSCK